jgi:hypothetical protein
MVILDVVQYLKVVFVYESVPNSLFLFLFISLFFGFCFVIVTGANLGVHVCVRTPRCLWWSLSFTAA